MEWETLERRVFGMDGPCDVLERYRLPNGWLVRSTVYQDLRPISVNITFVPEGGEDIWRIENNT